MSYQGTKMNPSKFHRSQLKFYAILIPLAFFMMLPIMFIIFHAFKPIDELFAFPPRFIVQKPTLDNFRELFFTTSTSGIPFSRFIFNSLLVTLSVMFFSVFISSLAAYAMSKMKFKLRKALFEVNTLALMFVPIAVQIPRYLVVVQTGILDTYFAHILPLLAMPIGLFLLKQFIDQVPDELKEAAVIDGASEFTVFRKVIVRVIMPALATVAILAFQAVWNNLETSNYYVNDEGLKTMSFFMSSIASQSGNTVAGQGMSAAASLIMFVPNLIIFILLQSKVMNTMAHSGLK
ncbi:carbohydrate ABC transporter permease [Paenibacillus sp. MER TA 81-3]|uniref:carbohydrate ABC transporter permease n=1 Tax=Paenibacillus sp. MER TA 81-3 TaxID=2939573 RepID=UPI00203C7628|nr:carbohydrate ABC transporter permease [Paenibacillus sp. MER TA 81-3]MCM3337638.1 carbohydrate ABC transporter permease [Paenibacillus sp. MER TA 81-3]